MTDYRGREYRPRTFTPEQFERERARKRRWYEENRESHRARSAERYRAVKANRPAPMRAATRIDIECAIARGLSAPEIVEQLGVTAKRVHKVWDALDELVATG